MIVPKYSDVDIVMMHPKLMDVSSTSVKYEVLKRDPTYIQYMKAPSEEFQLFAVRTKPYAYSYISSPTYLVKLYMVYFEKTNAINDKELFIETFDDVIARTINNPNVKWGDSNDNSSLHVFEHVFEKTLDAVFTQHQKISKWKLLVYVIKTILKRKRGK